MIKITSILNVWNRTCFASHPSTYSLLLIAHSRQQPFIHKNQKSLNSNTTVSSSSLHFIRPCSAWTDALCLGRRYDISIPVTMATRTNCRFISPLTRSFLLSQFKCMSRVISATLSFVSTHTSAQKHEIAPSASVRTENPRGTRRASEKDEHFNRFSAFPRSLGSGQAGGSQNFYMALEPPLSICRRNVISTTVARHFWRIEILAGPVSFRLPVALARFRLAACAHVSLCTFVNGSVDSLLEIKIFPLYKDYALTFNKFYVLLGLSRFCPALTDPSALPPDEPDVKSRAFLPKELRAVKLISSRIKIIAHCVYVIFCQCCRFLGHFWTHPRHATDNRRRVEMTKCAFKRT